MSHTEISPAEQADRLAIRELIDAYALCADRRLAEEQKALFTGRKVKVFLYNQQVTDPLTESLIALAGQNHIPVVGVYETMPTGYSYQRWMLAEVQALQRAVADHKSTEKL